MGFNSGFKGLNKTRHVSAKCASPVRYRDSSFHLRLDFITSDILFDVVTGSGATGIRIDVAGISMSYCVECRTRDKLKQVLEPAFEITHVASGNVSQCRSDIRLSFLLHIAY